MIDPNQNSSPFIKRSTKNLARSPMKALEEEKVASNLFFSGMGNDVMILREESEEYNLQDLSY